MISPDNCHRGVFSIADPLPAYAFPTTVSCEPLSDRLWTATDDIFRSIFIEGDEGIIAFDTFWSPAAAMSYRTAITRVLPDREIHTVVYSHDHIDHTGFASDLAPEATNILAHEETARVIEGRGSDGQIIPTRTWSGERTRVKVDGVEFELINPGSTHGTGNSAAWFPDAGVLFMVDTVFPGVGPMFMPDFHLDRYVDSMRRLETLDWEKFVPGHFWPMDKRGFAENLAFHERLAEVARQALADGIDPDHYPSIDQYAREHLTDEFGRLFRFGEYIGMNLMRFMAQEVTGGWGLEDASERRSGALASATEVVL